MIRLISKVNKNLNFKNIGLSWLDSPLRYVCKLSEALLSLQRGRRIPETC